jgi:glyoxylase-like metal-dependent hydrolase (beta-lactamase superfamily II)
VLAHPRAARHIVDPARLVAGAKAVYGEEAFQRLYGDIEGVPADRVRVMQDGEELLWGDRQLRFFYTLGHASHHFCVYDSGSNGVFTGDAFGLGLTDLVRPGPPFLICSTSPPDFDAEEAYRSVRMIEETGADWAFLPHFGPFPDLPRGAVQMTHALGLMENILNEAVFGEIAEEDLDAFCLRHAEIATRTHLEWCGVSDLAFDLAWLGEDIRLNAMGLAYVARRMRNKRGFE